MTALLIRIIPCQITRWVKPHPYVLLKVGTGVYGFIGAELDDTNNFVQFQHDRTSGSSSI